MKKNNLSLVPCVESWEEKVMSCCVFKLILIVLIHLFTNRCCSRSVLFLRIQILMILWCRRLLTCTRQTGANTRQLQGAGPRSMQWVSMLPCGVRGGFLSLVTGLLLSYNYVLENEEVWWSVSVFYKLWIKRERLEPSALFETQLLLSLFVWEFAFSNFRLFIKYPKAPSTAAYPFVCLIVFYFLRWFFFIKEKYKALNSQRWFDKHP